MTNVISKISLENLAYNVFDAKAMPQKVVLSRNLDDRYLIVIRIGDLEAKIPKEDLARIL